MASKISSILTAAATALAILSGSIAVPLLLRPFYAWHLAPLRLEGVLGLGREEILAVYDDVMDYCMGLRSDFAAGPLPFSSSGADHFADVRFLFLLDFFLLLGALAALAGLAVWRKKAGFSNYRFCDHTPGFWSACGLGAAFLLIAVLASLNFDRAFTVFHGIFFPGKSNWIFDVKTDPVILLLPQEYFRNCALLILGTLLLLGAFLVWWDFRENKKKRHGA